MKTKICFAFQKGTCTYGNKCKWSHEAPSGPNRHAMRQDRNHPYQKPNKNTRADRQSNDGQGRGRNDKQEQQQTGRGMQQQPSRQDAAAGRQQQLQQKGSGAQTPLSPNESYPLPPAEDAPPQQQQQQQQQQPQRPQQQQGVSALQRARAMCKLLNIGSAAPLVSAEMEASAVKFFSVGAFFRETPFADSIEKFLPQGKQ